MWKAALLFLCGHSSMQILICEPSRKKKLMTPIGSTSQCSRVLLTSERSISRSGVVLLVNSMNCFARNAANALSLCACVSQPGRNASRCSNKVFHAITNARCSSFSQRDLLVQPILPFSLYRWPHIHTLTGPFNLVSVRRQKIFPQVPQMTRLENGWVSVYRPIVRSPCFCRYSLRRAISI